MQPSIATLAIVGAVLAAVSGAATAVPCYRVLDSTDRVVYQNMTPPVDMSTKGAPELAALRARGGFLMIMDTDQCFELVFDSALLADARPKTVDEIVSGYRHFMGNSGFSRFSTYSGGSGGRASPAPVSSSGALPSSRY